jgi:hypothetical protein
MYENMAHSSVEVKKDVQHVSTCLVNFLVLFLKCSLKVCPWILFYLSLVSFCVELK